jgi:hypothetical protein
VVRFSLDRRWATLVVAMALGAGGGSLLGFLTAPAPSGDATSLARPRVVAPSTTRRQRGRFAGVSSTTTATTRRRPVTYPAVTAGLSPARGSTTTSTVRPTSTTLEPTSSSTSTTGDTTSSSTSSSTSTSTP